MSEGQLPYLIFGCTFILAVVTFLINNRNMIVTMKTISQKADVDYSRNLEKRIEVMEKRIAELEKHVSTCETQLEAEREKNLLLMTKLIHNASDK